VKSEEVFAREAELLRQGLNEWAEEGSLPPERSLTLEALVRRLMAEETSAPAEAPAETPRRARVSARRRWIWIAAVAAAAAAIAVPAAVPSARAWAVETLFPALARFFKEEVEQEPGWAWAEQHGYFQEVLASAEDQGYTFRVHRVLADTAQTTIIYSVEGPNPEDPDFWAGDGGIRFNGKEILTSGGGSSSVIDGVLVGHFEMNDPLPEVSGTLEIDLRQIGDVEGRWQVSFAVTREPLTALARTIQVDQVLRLGDVDLQVTQVELLPTHTVVRLHYEGSAPAPSFPPIGEPKLITSNGPLESRGGSGRGTFSPQGVGAFDRMVDFDPLPEGTTEVTLWVGAALLPMAGQKLSVPLQVGATAAAGDLPVVTVEEVDHASAVVSWPHDFVSVIEDWWVVDDQGEAHRTDWTGGTDANGIMHLTVSWNPLPEGRRPVALEARRLAHLVEGPWELQIPLN